jgi:CRISPR-associated protein Csc3
MPNPDPNEQSDEEAFEEMRGLLDYFSDEDEESTRETGTESPESTEAAVVDAYMREVDPKLVDAGWLFEAAKSTEHGKTDQSLVNHVRNGVTALARVNEVIDDVGGYARDEAALRDAAALFVIHDLHKLDRERDADPKTRFDIPEAEVERYVEEFDLLSWSDSLELDDFLSCAVDHHDDWTANHDGTTTTFDTYRPFVRLADAFASSETLEEATSRSVTAAVGAAYPGASFELRRHRLDDVKGVLTNLVNAAVAETLAPRGYEQLLVYQDGCVYLTPEDAPTPTLDDEFAEDVFENLKTNVQNAHPSYQNASGLAQNLATRSQGFYGINDQDFFYAGPATVLEAVLLNGIDDADPGSDPTDSMADSMAELETYLSFEIDRTREPVGLARLVYTVKRSFVDPVLEETDAELSSLAATCEIFGVDESVRSRLETAADEVDLTAGGKWDYAYGVAQALVNEGAVGTATLADRVERGLSDLDDDWESIVEADRTGNLRSELDAYLRDVLSVDGHTVTAEGESVTDPFEQYHGARRGKTCVLCNRGTTSTRKSDMEAPKSLTTLQAGYSNHIPVDAGKPDELLACVPCQVELSLRETGSSRREGGRIFVHLVPDYFYTPLSWRQYTGFIRNFSGESRTELGRLADAVLRVGTDGVDGTGDDEDSDSLGSYADALLDSETGRSMVETLDQGFDPDRQFGARSLAYFKPKDNDTEFQFFGVFVALAIGAYTGLRVVVSESPIPDVLGRDFQSYARIGGGFTQVHDFYGREVRLSDLRSRLNAAAALIQLGYGAEREDALFAKYLRATRNKLLPGSYLLKRLAQTDDGRDAYFLLEEARILDEERGHSVDP